MERQGQGLNEPHAWSTSDLKRLRKRSGSAGTLFHISTVISYRRGSIVKILPAGPPHPYPPVSSASSTLPSPQPRRPPRSASTASESLLTVIMSTVFALRRRTPF